MNKEIKVIKKGSRIEIKLNDSMITFFEISKNKINGKDLFEKLDVKAEDKFTLLPHGISNDTKIIDEIVVINTHAFLEKVINRINSKLSELREQSY